MPLFCDMRSGMSWVHTYVCLYEINRPQKRIYGSFWQKNLLNAKQQTKNFLRGLLRLKSFGMTLRVTVRILDRDIFVLPTGLVTIGFSVNQRSGRFFFLSIIIGKMKIKSRNSLDILEISCLKNNEANLILENEIEISSDCYK